LAGLSNLRLIIAGPVTKQPQVGRSVSAYSAAPMRLPLACVAALAALSGCGGGSGGDRELTVLAASSLTDALTEVAAAFEEEHPGIEVALSFDASSSLAAQIREGVPADVFASADEESIAGLVGDDLVAGAPAAIATNELVIVVAEGNPERVAGLADLVDGLRLALCAAEVPCGRYTAGAFARAGLAVPAASEEENVRGVLTKVSLGEADAGIVYATDLEAADAVEAVALAPEHQVRATYPAVVLAEASNPQAARDLLAFLTGPTGQAILAEHGFGPP
jgi:molybdate transport system substrate-binding protein